MSTQYRVIRHSKGPWKDHKYKEIKNGQYVYDDAAGKATVNKNEQTSKSFVSTSVYKTNKMDGPLKGVPYKQAAGGWYLYDNFRKNGQGKFIVYTPDGKQVYINSLDEFKALRKGKTNSSNTSSSSSAKTTKKKTPTEQIEEIKEQISEVEDLEDELGEEDSSEYDALMNRELQRLAAEKEAKQEALKKKREAIAFKKKLQDQKDKARKKKQFENRNKVTNVMEHNDDSYRIICHSKGPWKKHKYLKIVGGQYIYRDSNLIGEIDKVYNKSKSNGYDKAKEIASKVGGGKVGDTTRSVKTSGGKTNTAGVAYDFSGKNDKSAKAQKIDSVKKNAHSSKEQSVMKKLSDKNYVDTIDRVQYYSNPDENGTKYVGVTKTGRLVYVDKLPRKKLGDKLGFDERKALKEATNDAARAKELNQKTLAKGGDAKASTIYAINKQNQKEQAQKEYDRTDLGKAEKKVNETVENVGKAVSGSADKAKKLIKKVFRHSDMYGIDYGYAIVHSAKGDTWKNHKYIRKEGDRYIYKEDVGDTNRGKTSALERAQYISKITTGKKVGDTTRSLKNNPAGHAYKDLNTNDDDGLSGVPCADKLRKVGVTGKDFIRRDSYGFINYDIYNNPKYGETNKDGSLTDIGKCKYIIAREGYPLMYEQNGTLYDFLVKENLSDKIGLTQRKGAKEASEKAKNARESYAKNINPYVSPKEYGTLLDTVRYNAPNFYKEVVDLSKDAERLSKTYDATPLGKAEKKVNEIKSDIKSTGKKVSSTVKNTGKKVGSTLKDLEGKVVKEKETIRDSKRNIIYESEKPSTFKEVGSDIKKGLSNAGSKLKSGLSNIVKTERKTTVTEIPKGLTKEEQDIYVRGLEVTRGKKKVKHSELYHSSYRIVKLGL